jgi:hypothetical protein
MPTKRFNKKLLLRVKAHILEEPKRLTMLDWATKNLVPGAGVHADYFGQTAPTCGTMGCIAGWTVMLSPPINKGYDPPYYAKEAADLLGIQYNACVANTDPASSLFYLQNWPSDLRDQYRKASRERNQTQLAQVTAERIDRFITEHTKPRKPRKPKEIA